MAQHKAFDLPIPSTDIRLSGDTQIFTLMGNVFYDIEQLSFNHFTPFVGVGIGYAATNFTKGYNASIDPSVPPLEGQLILSILDALGGSVNDNLFAYQGTVGLSYDIKANASVDLSYRYLRTSPAKNINIIAYQANLVRLGFTYRF